MSTTAVIITITIAIVAIALISIIIFLLLRRVHPNDIPHTRGSFSVVAGTTGTPLLENDKGKKIVKSLQEAMTLCGDVCSGFSYDHNFGTMTIIDTNGSFKENEDIDSYFRF